MLELNRAAWFRCAPVASATRACRETNTTTSASAHCRPATVWQREATGAHTPSPHASTRRPNVCGTCDAHGYEHMAELPEEPKATVRCSSAFCHAEWRRKRRRTRMTERTSEGARMAGGLRRRTQMRASSDALRTAPQNLRQPAGTAGECCAYPPTRSTSSALQQNCLRGNLAAGRAP